MELFNNIAKWFTEEGKKVSVLYAAAVSNIGKVRSNNEDNFCFNGQVMESTNNGTDGKILNDTVYLNRTDRYYYFGLYDGMGGGEYGEIASFTAASFGKNYLEDKSNIDTNDISRSLEELFIAMNLEVVKSAKSLGTSKMGSTMVSAFFYNGRVWVSNLGDSKCFLYRQNSLTQLSVDHTDIKILQASGITGRKPSLTQHLGIDPEHLRLVPSISKEILKPGDLYILCSDGLTDMVSNEDINTILKENQDLDSCIDKLLKTALENGGKDNITIIVIRAE